MVIGKCRLCFGDNLELVEGHVSSDLIYRRYIRDDDGLFIDLSQKKPTVKAETKFWFCRICDNERLSKSETSAGHFFDALEKTPDQPIPYTDRFFSFILSISWRNLMAALEGKVTSRKELDALRKWRRFLFGLDRNIGRYSQHVYRVFDLNGEMNGELLRGYFSHLGIMCLKLGPLIIVSVISDAGRSLAAAKSLERSRLLPDGGVLMPLKELRIPEDVARALGYMQKARDEQTPNSPALKHYRKRAMRRKGK